MDTVLKVIQMIVAFLLGGCFISCGNCIAYRKSNGLDWVKERSFCEGCHRKLRFWEMIPVFSCLFLCGKCHKCNYHFGFRHAILEACGGVLCMLVGIGAETIYQHFMRCCGFGLIYCIYGWVSGWLTYHRRKA